MKRIYLYELRALLAEARASCGTRASTNLQMLLLYTLAGILPDQALSSRLLVLVNYLVQM